MTDQRFWGAVGLVLIAAIVFGCPARTPAPQTPELVIRSFAEAVLAGKLDQAYEHMSPDFRKRHDRKEFARRLKESPAEVRGTMEQLKSQASRVALEAVMEYGDQETLRLSLENGQWRISSDPVDFYGQSTPADALRSFVRALERRRYDVVLRFVPARWAGSMTADKIRREWEGEKRDEVAHLIKQLKANLKSPIVQTGDSASLPYGENNEVRFLREDGVWKIEDPD